MDDLRGQTATAIRFEAWATPKPGMSLDELIAEMREVGNEVLEVDRAGNRVKLADVTEALQ